MDRQIVLSDDEVGASSHYDTFREIAVLRIGGASARRALNAYYHKVSPRGFIFVRRRVRVLVSSFEVLCSMLCFWQRNYR